MRNNKCHWERRIDRYFDGEDDDVSAVEVHLETCPLCRANLERLSTTRRVLQSTRASVGIEDPQLRTLLDGIRGGLRTPAKRPMGGALAWLSVTTAALIVAVSTYALFFSGPGVATASVVEACETELSGASTSWNYTDEGVTVWVNYEQDDLW